MLYEFSSAIGYDLMTDEAYVENIFSDDIIQRMYNSPELSGLKVDMGGHVHVLTCRSVLRVCHGDPTKLSKILNYRGKSGVDTAQEIITECQRQVDASSFLI